MFASPISLFQRHWLLSRSIEQGVAWSDGEEVVEETSHRCRLLFRESKTLGLTGLRFRSKPCSYLSRIRFDTSSKYFNIKLTSGEQPHRMIPDHQPPQTLGRSAGLVNHYFAVLVRKPMTSCKVSPSTSNHSYISIPIPRCLLYTYPSPITHTGINTPHPHPPHPHNPNGLHRPPPLPHPPLPPLHHLHQHVPQPHRHHRRPTHPRQRRKMHPGRRLFLGRRTSFPQAL